jgi:hypothetical protein
MKNRVIAELAKGVQKTSDIIPWTLAQNFQDHDFASLAGARIIKIATHPDYQHVRKLFYPHAISRGPTDGLLSISMYSDIISSDGIWKQDTRIAFTVLPRRHC